MSAVLDALLERANKHATEHKSTRRPTWAPPLVLEGEIVTLLRELEWRKPEDKNVARLWARFSSPKRGPVQCLGFELRAGDTRSGERIFETMREKSGEWWSGPQWLPPKEPEEWSHDYTKRKYPEWLERYKLRVRAVELGTARVADFAGNPDEQMRLGGIMTGSCAICGRLLTDPISLERGIGPECWANARPLGAFVEQLQSGGSA